jgi:transposase-like protein
MARAYSLELRERVVAAVADGLSCRALADRFGVSVVASVVKWSQRLRATGSVAAKLLGGRRPYALEGERDWLLARVGEAPDLTLRALAAELAARGILEPLRGVAPADPGRHHLQEKACAPASRNEPMWCGGGRNGRSIRAGLIPHVWSSSARLGPRPI